MKGRFSIDEFGETVGIGRRRVYQLVREGVIERLPDGTFNKTAIRAYNRHLRHAIAKYSGKSRGNPSPKPKPMTPEEVEESRAIIKREIDEMISKMAALKKRR